MIDKRKFYINGTWITTGGVGSVIRQIHNQLKHRSKKTKNRSCNWQRSRIRFHCIVFG